MYNQFLRKEGFQVFGLDDLLAQERNFNLHKLISDIKVPKSTVYLVLDQILVSMGSRVVLVSKPGVTSNSFHQVIKTRHNNYSE